MKNILITGSNGLLGQKIVGLLKDQDDVCAIATSKGTNRISDKDGYLYEMMDVRLPLEITDVVKRLKPDAIINTAAMTNVNLCEEEQETCEKTNVDAVAHLIQVCQENDIHLTHLSTDFVFDGKDGPYKETDKTNPQSFYAASKRKSEILLEQSSIRWSVLRTILVYGVCEKMTHSNFVLWAVHNLQAGKPIRVVDDQFRSPTLAEDLAQACIASALRGAQGIFHVGGPKTKSIYELVEEVADCFDLDKSLMSKSKTSDLNEPAPRPERTGFILTKAREQLEYLPRSFSEGLQLVRQQMQTIPYKL